MCQFLYSDYNVVTIRMPGNSWKLAAYKAPLAMSCLLPLFHRIGDIPKNAVAYNV